MAIKFAASDKYFVKSIQNVWKIKNNLRFSLFLPHLPAGEDYQEGSCGYAADFLEVAPELSAICLALLAKLFSVFGLVAAAFFAGFPEFLGHR